MDLAYNVHARPAEGQPQKKDGKLQTVTFDHKSLPKADNAVDFSRKGEQNVILTRGNADVMGRHGSPYMREPR